MRGVWTADQVRAAEQRVFTRVPESRLMRIAAYAVANEVLALLAARTGGTSGRRVGLLVGAGNNGGDALWAGAFLCRRGVSVTAVLLAPERAHAAGLAAFRRAGGRVGSSVAGVDVVVDGIVGLSAKGSLRPDAAALVESVTAPIVAVDLPSGVDPDTGAVDGPHVRATVTVTFGGRKPCHVVGPGAVACGHVRVVDIGIADDLDEPHAVILDADDVADAWPIPGPSDDKYSQGVTGIAAGSATYPGAAVLSTGAAVLATSGMVRYAGTAADVVRSRWPEVVATGHVGDSGRVQAWVVGPGLGTGKAGREVLVDVLAADVPVCADADAITLLAGDPTLWDARDPETPLVLTPHDREFARLAGEVGPDRISAARRAAARFHAVVLLKGHSTVVAAPDGRVLVSQSRSSWPATAGSGDVLSGLIGALLAAGEDPWLAAGCAAYVHELAADLAADGAPAPASHIQAAISDAIRHIRAL
ncbi:NAD(P)H-hydrate dehydratase [Kutzneria sp. NPDC051319]|uniref:NAD(P)H-hydrate dehydratase n=1 Tax=Kutzneria sp. NPDC051319 TaxID=3155047 RepID=UPI0034151EDA